MLAALDAAHVGSVKTAVVGKRLLREALLLPQLTNSVTEDHP
jgi:hypothetical protein